VKPAARKKAADAAIGAMTAGTIATEATEAGLKVRLRSNWSAQHRQPHARHGFGN
jgi:hypothetical protein